MAIPDGVAVFPALVVLARPFAGVPFHPRHHAAPGCPYQMRRVAELRLTESMPLLIRDGGANALQWPASRQADGSSRIPFSPKPSPACHTLFDRLRYREAVKQAAPLPDQQARKHDLPRAVSRKSGYQYHDILY